MPEAPFTLFLVGLAIAGVAGAVGVVSALLAVRWIHGRSQAPASAPADAAAPRPGAAPSSADGDVLWRRAVETEPEGVCLLDASGSLRRMNAAASRMLEATSGGATSGLSLAALVDLEDRPSFVGLIASVFRGETTDSEIRITGLKGTRRWLSISAAPLRDDGGQVSACLGVLHDISEHKRAEGLLRWEKRALELVARSGATTETLDALMRGLEEQAPGALCSVLLLDESRTRLMFGGAPSLPREYTAAVDGVTIGPRVGSCGSAAYHNRQVIVSDITVDPLWTDFRELTAQYGLRACWSTPIRSDSGEVLGTFAVYYREPRLPSPFELELIDRAQSIVALAIMRAQAEAALRGSRERLDLALAGGELGVWEWNPRTNRTTHSPSWAQLFGYAPDEVGNHLDWFAPHVHPDDRPAVLQKLEDHLAGRSASYSSQHRVRCKDGSWKWVFDRGNVIRADADGPTLVAGVVSDVTPLKQAAAALLESQQRYEVAVRGSSDGLWDWDMRTNVAYFSPRWKSMLGYEDHEVANTYESWLDLLHPDDREHVMQALAAYLDGSAPAYAPEFRMRAKDGGYRWILARGAVLRGDDGQPIRMAGSHSDITERKEAERALRSSQRMIEAIIDAIPVRVFWKDRNLKFLGCNGAFARDAGFTTPADLVGLDDFQMGWREHAERYRADDLAVIESGQPAVHIEEPLTTPDGQVITLLTSKVPLRSEAGEVVGVLGTYLDISERKRAEDEVHRLNRDLEATVLARTSALQQREEQLRDIFDGTSDLIQSVAMDGTILLTNRAWRDTLGYSASEAAGLNIFSIIHPDQRQHCRDFFAELAASGGAGVLETVVLAKDGRQCELEGSVSVSRDGEGMPTATRGIFRDVTARRASDRALRQSEETYRLLFSSSQDAIVTLHPPDWRFRESNRAAVTLFGAATEQDLEHESPWALSPECQPDGRPSASAAREYIDVALATGSCSFEWEHCRLDGSQFTASIRLSRVDQRDGSYLQAAVRDITAQKQSETALRELNERLDQLVTEKTGQLRESEARFRQLVEASPNTVLMTAPDGRISFVNRRAEAMFGYRPDELIGRSVEVLVPEGLRAGHAEKRAQNGQSTHSRMMGDGASFPALRKDGSVVQVEIGLTPIATSAGPFMMSTIADVTARREAEDALLTTEKRKAAIFESTLDALVTFDPTGRIVEWNGAAERIFGHPVAAAIGQEMAELIVPPDLRDDHRGHVAQLASGSAEGVLGRRFSYKAQRADGSVFPVEAYVAPTGGNPPLYTAFIRDVTDRLALEAQLRQAQKMEAIGQLAGGVAHDFNNILMVVMMQAEAFAMAEGLSPEALESLDEIRTSAERGTALTRQLLLFSRRQVMHTRDADLNEVVTALAKMLQRIIGEDITLELHLHATRLVVRADVGMLDQVLLNLAVNARDAMPRGGRLRIETFEKAVDRDALKWPTQLEPGRFFGISVADTGVGIPPEVLPRIFEPFYTTKEAGKGTGLGLATVFGIVEQHHGWLDVSSTVGQGTRVDVYLPAVDLSRQLPAAQPLTVRVSGGTETILVVEDEATVRTVITRRLERGGYTVLSAASGVEALAIWQSRRDDIDLLVTDLVMPEGIAGQELGRRLRADRPGLGVVYCSGYSPDIAGRELTLEDGETFLQKPFPAVTLLSAVRRTLDATRATA